MVPALRLLEREVDPGRAGRVHATLLDDKGPAVSGHGAGANPPARAAELRARVAVPGCAVGSASSIGGDAARVRGSLRGRGTISMSQLDSARTRRLTLPRRNSPRVDRPCLPATIRSASSPRAWLRVDHTGCPWATAKPIRVLPRPSLAALRRMRAMVPASCRRRDSRMTCSGTSVSRSTASR